MNLFSNLSSDQQRIFVLIGVGVVAVLGLFVLTRGGGSESSTPSTPPAQSSPAKPDSSKSDPAKPDSSQQSDGDQSSSAAKPSKQAYLDCVEQATDTAALEKCQAVLP